MKTFYGIAAAGGGFLLGWGLVSTGNEGQAALSPASPPEVTRGPYLQRATTSNIVVRWRTSEPTDSRVQFGLAADALEWEVFDQALTTEHLVTLTNLAPDTRYFYAVGTGERQLSGGVGFRFRTHPATSKPTRIWAIGDSGTATAHLQGLPGHEGDQVAVRDAYYTYAGTRETDVWLMLGDNAYLSGTDQQYQETMFDIYPRLLRQCAVWPTIGNHDVNYWDGFPYLKVFSLPTQAEAGGVASGSPNYYSFDYGNIHFVCLDSEVSGRSPNGAMLTWLEADLTANPNEWLIAFWHRPPYSFSSHNSDDEGPMIEMRENVMPILETHGVDLVLTGHSHSYERSYLLDGHYGFSDELLPTMIRDSGSGRPDDTGAYLKAGVGPHPHQGTVQVVAGSSGWVTGDVLAPLYKHPVMFIKLKELGSMVIDVNSNRLDAKFLRETGAIDDYFTILKGMPPEPLRIATFRVRDGVVNAQWKSVAGQFYRVERATRLENPDWQPASDDIEATGATTAWTSPVSPGAEKHFYRVLLVE
jgi:acid phosphatase type 7